MSNKKTNTCMIKTSFKHDSVIITDSLEEATEIDPELQNVDLLVIGGKLARQKNWKPAEDQQQIPEEFLADSQLKDKVVVRIGLGYLFLLDVSTKTCIKVFDTKLQNTLNRYLCAY